MLNMFNLYRKVIINSVLMKEKMLIRTKKVGLDVIQLLNELPNNTSSWAISKQIVRSSTSVGANYRAACRAKSAADFINKLKIVEEEADETIYWMEILEDSGLIKYGRLDGMKSEVKEVLSIVVSAIKTMRKKHNT